jgi:hypothetical protein
VCKEKIRCAKNLIEHAPVPEIGDTSVYYHALKPEIPGRLEYKFIVDGKVAD